MQNVNQVVIEGRLTQQPELRYTPDGTAVGNFSMATNRDKKHKPGEKAEEIVAFVDVVVWAKQAEAVAEYLKKGSRVLVSGRLDQERWQEPDGRSRSKLFVTADQVNFLDSKAAGNTSAPGPGGKERKRIEKSA